MSRARSISSAIGIVLAAIALLARGVEAQSVKGVVTDHVTELPLPGVLVSLLDTVGVPIPPGVRSDSAGGFVIHVASPGAYRFVATRDGFQTLSSGAILLRVAEIVVLKFPMAAVTPAVAQRVTSVEVTGRRPLTEGELMSPLGFDVRHTKGLGESLDLGQLARLGTATVRAALEGHALASVSVRSTPSGDTLAMARCDSVGTDVYLDGTLISVGRDAAQLALATLSAIAVSRLHGIEAYDARRLPPPVLRGSFGLPGAPRYSDTLAVLASPSALDQKKPRCVFAAWTREYATRIAVRTALPPRATVVAGFQSLRGTVVDFETLAPIPDVMVSVLPERDDEPIGKAVRSDSLGGFIVRTRSKGLLRLMAQRIGFSPVTTAAFVVGADDMLTFQLEMSATRQVLAPLMIIAREQPKNVRLNSFDGFVFRKQRGLGGIFVTADEIFRTGAVSVGSILRNKGADILITPTDDGSSSEMIVFRRATAIDRRVCPAQFVLDGMPLRAAPVVALSGETIYPVPQIISNMPITDIKGIEVYRSFTEMPGEFYALGSECGVVVIWTKNGSEGKGGASGA
jgi:hypothetical protein